MTMTPLLIQLKVMGLKGRIGIQRNWIFTTMSSLLCNHLNVRINPPAGCHWIPHTGLLGVTSVNSDFQDSHKRHSNGYFVASSEWNRHQCQLFWSQSAMWKTFFFFLHFEHFYLNVFNLFRPFKAYSEGPARSHSTPWDCLSHISLRTVSLSIPCQLLGRKSPATLTLAYTVYEAGLRTNSAVKTH